MKSKAESQDTSFQNFNVITNENSMETPSFLRSFEATQSYFKNGGKPLFTSLDITRNHPNIKKEFVIDLANGKGDKAIKKVPLHKIQ